MTPMPLEDGGRTLEKDSAGVVAGSAEVSGAKAPLWRVLEGDALTTLRQLEARSVQTCVTSPPYFGLRDYGHEGQLGLEATPDEYVASLVGVFREVRRVLRDDGTLWLNLGDSYCSTDKWGGGVGGNTGKHTTHGDDVPSWAVRRKRERYPDAKPKDLLGIPWLAVFALRADGWYLRSDIIWSKPNPMPESVTDRPTKAHEYLFLLSKQPRYFYDADAIREPHIYGGGRESNGAWEQDAAGRAGADGAQHLYGHAEGRNKRVATTPFPGAHFAVFPPKLIEPCILAGSADRACGVCGAPWRRVVERKTVREVLAGRALTDGKSARTERPGDPRRGRSLSHSNSHDSPQSPEVRTVGWEPSCEHQDGTGSCVVLDPFAGAGTTGLVATRHGRGFTGIELNPEYAEMARQRIRDDAPLMNYLSEAAA